MPRHLGTLRDDYSSHWLCDNPKERRKRGACWRHPYKARTIRAWLLNSFVSSVLSNLHSFMHFVLISTLWSWRYWDIWRTRERTCQGHPVSKWQSQESKPGPGPKALLMVMPHSLGRLCLRVWQNPLRSGFAAQLLTQPEGRLPLFSRAQRRIPHPD